jgi:hypothetical protein
MTMQQWAQGDTAPWTKVNENFDGLAHQVVYAKDVENSTGLTWAYFGGRWGGFSVSAGTLTLSNNATNYIVVAIATGVTSVSSSSTNWSDTDNYARVYQVTTVSSAVTATQDHRAGPSGVHGGSGGGGGIAGVEIQEAGTPLGDATSINFVLGADFDVALDTDGVATVTIPEQGSDVVGGSGTQALFISVTEEEEYVNATATGRITFRMPYAMTLTAVRASLKTAQTSGTVITVDINESGTTILSTKITIDNSEKTSTTAATPPVISDVNLADDAEITIDIDAVGDGTAQGLKVYLIGTA